MTAGPGTVTLLLRRIRSGHPAAWHDVMEVLYPELHRMAQRFIRAEPSERVLQPTALVHEAYLRLVSHRDHNWENRAHFFAAAARVMRRILVDQARGRTAGKRSGRMIALSDVADLSAFTAVPSEDLLALEEALNELEKLSPRQMRVVELRYFGGLTMEEIAETLELTPKTVSRDWAVARAWLKIRLQP